MDTPFGLGANHSAQDPRTFTHPVEATAPIVSAGVSYLPEDIEHQHNVGICTAISTVQNAQKALQKHFSPDFAYMLQKKYVDLNWNEGSSIFVALKVAKNYGFLARELFPITEEDRKLPYPQYIAKLQAIPDVEVQRLIGLCTDKLAAYASVPVDRTSIAKAIQDSKAGILMRFDVGSEWWVPSWKTVDINPLKAPVNPVSGHAIGAPLITGNDIELCNTWGIQWNKQGSGDTLFDSYKPTEAWIPYYTLDAFPTDLYFGMTLNAGVVKLQTYLASIGLFSGTATGNYGVITTLAVKKFQANHGIIASGMRVGIQTRTLLNILVK